MPNNFADKNSNIYKQKNYEKLFSSEIQKATFY